MDVIKNLLIFSVVYFSLSSSSLLIAEKTDKKMSKKTSKKKKETKKTDVKKEKNTKDIKSAEASSPTAQKPLEKQNQIATVQKPAVDLAFLANDVKDTQKVYMLWKALVDDPMPNGPALKQFIIDHPDWPSINLLLKKYETTLNYQTPEEDILAWFNEHPPITLPAITLYAKILLRKGQTTKAVKLIKKTWYETSEYSKDLELFHKEFQDVLKPEDHQIRLDKLLTNEKIDEATKTLEWLNQQLNWFPESQRDLSKMRIDLINNNIKDQCLLEERLQKTKLIFKNDKGLIYEEIKWRRKNKENQKIFDIFQDSSLAGIEKGDPVLFWGERNIMVRRMIEEGNFEKAYAYVNGHQLTEGEHFINAEWLAAFLLMTYLNKPDEGYDRLKKLTDKVKMPISLSRIYYWLGQAALKMNSKDQAFDWFLKASYHIGTYYGQLARCILEDNGKKVPDISLFEEENIPLSIRQNFNKRELVKALTLMSNTQEPANLIETFLKTLKEQITDRDEYYLLVNLAAKVSSPKVAIEFSRLAKEKMIITKSTYPVLDDAFLNQSVNQLVTNNPLFPHLTHAVIRRESAFDADAISSAGAKGLMQVMDATAQKTIQKLSFLCKDGCKDPKTYTLPVNNVAIGTMYLKEMIEYYKGSLVLAICAYNAGPEAVDNLFCGCIGNPITTKTNMVEWVELIPFGETRNYVMRVLENLMMYLERARIDTPSVPLMRMTDLLNSGVKH